MKRLIPACFFFFTAIAIMACGGSQNAQQSPNTSPCNIGGIEYSKSDMQAILGILYQQQSAEYRALCYQAYNVALARITDSLKCKKPTHPFAIITDLDETALDNSAESAWLIKHDSTPGANISVFLRHWQADGLSGTWSGAVPGSVDFFNRVHNKGVTIYYISNRDSTDSIITATMIVMNKLGFPNSDTAKDRKYFLFKNVHATSSKESRRKYVEQDHNVIVLLGDNLGDLDSLFDGRTMDSRRFVDSVKERWGSRYIVFPNPVYGDWEQALYKTYKISGSIQSEDSIRIRTLDTTDTLH